SEFANANSNALATFPIGDLLVGNVGPDQTVTLILTAPETLDHFICSGEPNSQFSLTDLMPNTAPSDITLSNHTIEENAGENAVVGILSATDPDAASTFTFELVAGEGDIDNGSFNINGNELRANSSFDYETKDSYSIRVRVTDDGYATDE